MYQQKNLIIDHSRCTRCGACVEVCLGGCLWEADGFIQFDPTSCIVCNECADLCLSDALEER